MQNIITSEEAPEKYTEIYTFWQNLPNNAPPSKEVLDKTIEEFNIVEGQIINSNIISANEDFEEILPENLKFQVMPAILADLYTRKHDNRLDFLNKAEYQYHQFLKLMIHYKIVPKKQESIHDKIRDSTKYVTSRDEKIELFKDSKVNEDQMEVAKSKYMVDPKNENPREYMRLFQISLCYNAIDQLKFIPSEKEMLEYRKKLETCEDTRKTHEKENEKPLPKPKAWQIAQPHGRDKPVITQFGPKGVEKVYEGNPNLYDARIDKMNKVFQPGFQQPVMNMDAHGDLEYGLMCEKHARDAENAKLKQAAWDAMTKDEQEEIETQNAREWDDWQDANEKGAGNRAGKN